MDREAFEALMDFATGTSKDEIHYGFGMRVKDAQLLLGALALIPDPTDHAREMMARLHEFLAR